MSEEKIETNITTQYEELTDPKSGENGGQGSLLPGFKSVCTRLGLMMIVIFVCRLLLYVPVILFGEFFNSLDLIGRAVANLLLSLVFLYLIPMAFTAAILRFSLGTGAVEAYRKPQYMGKALGMYPAAYSIAIIVRLLTMLLGHLLSSTVFGRSFNATENAFSAATLPEALIQFVQLAIIAPLFEEFWFRKMVLGSLRTYGNGFAIFISAILFGMTHSNFDQFFYATALGIVLGYITVHTGSIIPSTIMHFFFNSFTAISIIMTTNTSVQDYLLAAQNGEEGVITPAVAVYIGWTCLIILLFLVGLIMAIIKLVKIKKFRVPKVQTEISTGTRWGVFFTRIPVAVAMLLAIFSFIPDFAPWLMRTIMGQS